MTEHRSHGSFSSCSFCSAQIAHVSSCWYQYLFTFSKPTCQRLSHTDNLQILWLGKALEICLAPDLWTRWCFQVITSKFKISPWNLFFLDCAASHGFLVSDVSTLPQHISAPLCCSPSVVSNFTLSPCSLAALRFLLCFPTSTHVCSCILHLHHHIRPVLFLNSSLIYIPPSPSLSHPALLFARCLGHSQLLKKASACTGLCGITYLVHYS